tara:strand:- start:9203 stop:9373 length:171 start_codon:yes stop_codon:yes gene_type:complete
MDDFYFKRLIIKGSIYTERGGVYHNTPGGNTWSLCGEEKERFDRLNREVELEKIIK